MKLTDQEIITALKEGGRIRLSWWKEDRYIYLHDGYLCNEDGQEVKLYFPYIDSSDWEVAKSID